jgi:predicted ATPase
MAEGDGTGTTETPRLAPGATLGRYEIRERLGAGGMGEAFRAFDPRLHREVAIKVIARRIQDRPDMLEQFEEEARAASALNHPNIVTVHDIGEQDDFPYIVMELVDGESLREHLSEPLPVERIVRLGSQLTGALAAAHERGVVHRDLKPENVVLTAQGVAKILDFGVARFQPVGTEAESLPTLDAEGVVGTVGYMAPEAMTGRPVDHRVDQFALGAILYEMATGRACFRRSSAAETVVATLKEEPEPLAAQRPDLPPALVQLTTRCLSKDPGHRYASTWAIHKLLATVPVDSAVRRRPNRAPLPSVSTGLFGRQDEIHQIQNLVLESRVRLLTVTGPGGCGKTRLAIEAARQLQPSFPGGVLFVPLSALRDPELVGPAIARATGATEAVSGRALPDLFVELAADRGPMLLVLDNFEQVVEAAAEVGELLASCPELTVLVTSREVLRLHAEHDFPLQPLAAPPADRLLPVEELGQFPAVALFVNRARAADPAFALTSENAASVAELCARLDGLPLALELAAVRTRTLTTTAMLERLGSRLKLLTGGPRDMPQRQRTLRQTIDWSYDLLEPAEQLVFQRLAVFAGGFTLEAAQAVADPFGRLDRDVEEVVGSLVDKSLLVRSPETTGDPRFTLLETVREYALERLAAGEDEEAVRKAYAAYFLVLAQDAELTERGLRGTGWMEEFSRERNNYRAALDWLVARDSADWSLQIIERLYHYWFRGGITEGLRRFEQVLALPSARALSPERGRCLNLAAGLASADGDQEKAIALARESVEVCRVLGDHKGQAAALNTIGVGFYLLHRSEEARESYEECLALWRKLGDKAGYARTLTNIATVLRQDGDLQRARQLYRQAAAMFEEAGDRVGAAWESSHEGDVALQQGDATAAGALYEQALTAFREQGEPFGAANALADLGDVAQASGILDEAAGLYRQALSAYLRLGHRRAARRALEGLAIVAAGSGRLEDSLLLAAAAATERARTGSRTHEHLKEALAAAITRAREELDPETAAATWRRGFRMSFEQAVQLAAGPEPQAEA